MKRLAALMTLLSLCLFAMPVFAQTEAALSDYATVTPYLFADPDENVLPDAVSNGQEMFFKLVMSDFGSADLIRYLKENSPVDLTVDIGFTGDIEGSYPTEMYPSGFDNVAMHNGAALFRWWIDGGKIRIRFDDEWIANAKLSTTIDGAELGFSGKLNVGNKPKNGRVRFTAGGKEFLLQFKTGYAITKQASAVYYRSGRYEVDYTVTFTLDQDMNITGSADADHYSAQLTLKDMLAQTKSAMTGEVVGTPSLTGPVSGLSVTAARSGGTNTFSIGGASVLTKGTYTLTYTMAVDSAAAAAELQGYDKNNTVELMENGASLVVNGKTSPLTAQASTKWNDALSNRYKVDKCIVNQNGNSVVYRVGDRYYVDYYIVVYSRDEVDSFTVIDRIISGVSHTANMPITLLGVNTAPGYWDRAAASGLPTLSSVDAAVTGPIDGLDRAITLTAKSGTLPAGAYYMKMACDVTDTVLALSEAAQKKVGDNTAGDAYAEFKNKAILDIVNGDSHVNEVTRDIVGRLNGPTAFYKHGEIQMNNDGSYIIYDKEGVRGKYIRWDVVFDWEIPNTDTVITDMMKGDQSLLVNASTPFTVYDTTSGKDVVIAELKNLTDTEYIDFGKDSSGNETFSFYPGRMTDNPQDSTRKFKLTYYTLVPEETVDFSPMTNSWTVEYKDEVPGVGVGPVNGEEKPQISHSARLELKKTWKYFVNDYVTRWLIEIKNPSKIPFDSLGRMVLVDMPRSTGTNAFEQGEVWIDHDRMLTDLPLVIEAYTQNGQREVMTLGTHYTISKTHSDYDLGKDGRNGFAIEFNIPAIKELLKPHRAAHFMSIGIACYVHNADKQTSNTKRWNITNDAYLDYTVSGIDLPDEDATATVGREYSTGSKTVGATVNSQKVIYHDYDGDGDKEVRWQVKVGANEFKTYPEPIRITVTDTLPEEMTLDGIAGDGWKTAFRVWATGDTTGKAVIDLTKAETDASFTYNESTNTFALSFVKPKGDWAVQMGASGAWVSCDIGVEYHTVFKPGELQRALDKAGSSAVSVTIPLSNSASVEWMGNTCCTPSADGDAVVTDIALDKQAAWMASAGNKVKYTIHINPYGLNLGSDGVIRMQDTMGAGKDAFVYLDSTFRVIDAATGMQLARSSSASANTYALSVAEDGKSFTIDVPDGRALTLEYQVKTTKPVGTKDVSLQNSASLEGRTITPVEIVFDVRSSYQSGSFTLQDDEAGIRILKIDSRDAEAQTVTGLRNAVFTVTELDASGRPAGQAETLSTDSNGLITIVEEISQAKILLIEETQAPSGYMLDEEPWKWCYVLVPVGMSAGSVPDELEMLLGCGVTVVTAGSYAEDVVANEPAAVIIAKQNADGEPLFGAEFELKTADGTMIEPDEDAVAGTTKYSGLTAGSYTLRETKAPAGYVLGGENVWTFTVAADGSVSLPADAAYTLLSLDGNRLIVTNESLSTSAQFSGSKILTGKPLEAGAFSFELVDAAGNALQSVQNGADGSFSFEPITYTLKDAGKTFTYTVKENAGSEPGMAYDDTVYTVTVNVAYDGSNTLTATASANASALDFANAFSANDALTLTARKTVNGEDARGDQVFSFVLADESGNVLQTVQNSGSAIAFAPIEYDQDDVGKTFVYTVYEAEDDRAYYTADGSLYTVTVTIGLDDDNALTILKDVHCGEEARTEIVFDNTYTAEGSLQLTAAKTVNGAVPTADQVFSFELTDEAGNILQTVRNNGGEIIFAPIEYDQDDAGKTYIYTVKETAGSEPGMTYDGTIYNVTVDVTDNRDGTLTITPSANASALDFANTFSANGALTLTARKTVNGEDARGDQVFSFVLADESGNVLQTVQNNGGVIAFAPIEYDQDDVGKTFVYTVYEAGDDRAYYTTDGSIYTVTVTVGLDDDNALTILKDVRCGEEARTEIVFDNAYTAAGSLQLTAAKTVNGAVPTADQVYSFLLEGEGVSMEAVNEGGTIVFDALTYDLSDAGNTYVYTVRETTASEGSLTADASVYTVSVTVADNGDGTLSASYVVTRGGEAADGIAFNNAIGAPLTILKKVEGVQTDERFEIIVRFYDADGQEIAAPMPYTGDLNGELVSGGSIRLGHGQSVTFGGLQPGMRYVVEEADNGAFITTVNGQSGRTADGVCIDGENLVSFVNTAKTTQFRVRKSWEGERGGDITLTLYANGVRLEPQPACVRDGDVYTFTDLPMYDGQGNVIIYTATEKPMDGYITVYNNPEPHGDESGMIYDGGVIINRAVTSIRVRKVWQGLGSGETPPQITLRLLCNGQAVDRRQPEPDADGWYVYTNLPAIWQGKPAVYSVVEEPVQGFMTAYKNRNGEMGECARDGDTITNTRIPPTGDADSLAMWVCTLAAAGMILALLRLKRRA